MPNPRHGLSIELRLALSGITLTVPALVCVLQVPLVEPHLTFATPSSRHLGTRRAVYTPSLFVYICTRIANGPAHPLKLGALLSAPIPMHTHQHSRYRLSTSTRSRCPIVRDWPFRKCGVHVDAFMLSQSAPVPSAVYGGRCLSLPSDMP